MASVVIRGKVVMLLIHCILLLSLFVRVLCLVLALFAVLSVLLVLQFSCREREGWLQTFL